MDEFYRTYFAPYWAYVDLIWCAFGLWCALRPSMLVGTYGPLVLTRGVARWRGLSPLMAERVVSLADRRDDVKYDDRIGRIGGYAMIAVGLLGIVLSSDPAVVASLAVVIFAWTGALYSMSARPAEGGFVSLDAPRAALLSSLWVVAPLVVAAVAVAAVGAFASIVVGVSTLVITVTIWRIATAPGMFLGVDVALERQLDARTRLSRLATIATFSALPLLVWLLLSYADGFGSIRVQMARLVVEAAVFAQAGALLVASRRSNRDLKRIATTQ